MEGDGVSAFLLRDPADLQVVDLFGIPAGADLDRQRSVPGRPHRGDDAANVLGVAQQGTAASAFGDFGDGAAEIEIDEISMAGDQPRSLRQVLGIAAEELHAKGTFFRPGVEEFKGAIASLGAHQADGTDHFGKDQPCSRRLHDQAVGKVGNPGHGCENNRIFELEGTYLHRVFCIIFVHHTHPPPGVQREICSFGLLICRRSRRRAAAAWSRSAGIRAGE